MANDLAPLLVDVKAAAKLCSVSAKTFYSLDITGGVPESIRLKSCRRWSVAQLEVWVINGGPSRNSTEWIAILEKLRGEK